MKFAYSSVMYFIPMLRKIKTWKIVNFWAKPWTIPFEKIPFFSTFLTYRFYGL